LFDRTYSAICERYLGEPARMSDPISTVFFLRRGAALTTMAAKDETFPSRVKWDRSPRRACPREVNEEATKVA